LNKKYYGAAIYPELWDKETVESDIKHMKEIGMNLARFGEFAWSTLEPEQNQFNMSFLTNTLDTLKKYNMDAIVCTPTPTPPIWMTHNHQERLHHTSEKKPLSHGSRQHICTNNSFFRKRAAEITRRIVSAVKGYSNVIAFQLDNEFKCHVGPCYCDTCMGLWHEWLKKKYKTVSNLNESWETSIWSQRYQNFDQVVQPVSTPFLHNSSLIRTYQQFSMEKIADFASEQAEIIRGNMDVPVTHNSGLVFDLDNEILSDNIDFISFDTYATHENYADFMLNNDRWPYIKNNCRNFMLLETSTSYNGHTHDYGKLHPKGYVTAEAFATYASGAQAFSYWLFRGQKSGCEQPHGSVVSSWGEPTIGYDNVIKTSNMFKNIEPLIQSSEPVDPEIAITYSDRARSFFDNEPGDHYLYREMMLDYYKNFLDMGIERKLVPEGYNLEKSSVLFTPFVHYISEEYLSKIKTFVENGGIWIAGPMTGDRTKEHTWHTTHGLGNLGELAGVENIIQFPATDSGHVGQAFDHNVELGMMSTFFTPMDGTKVQGVVSEGQAAGYAFITEKEVKKGKIVLVGSMPMGDEGKELWKELINYYGSYKGLNNDLIIEPGLVIVPRKNVKNKRKQYWLVNFTNEMKVWETNKPLYDQLESKKLKVGKYSVSPFGYMVLEEV